MATAARQHDKGAQAYQDILDECASRARAMMDDGKHPIGAQKDAAVEYIKEHADHEDVNTRFLTACVSFSTAGPHESWTGLDFDNSDPDGALKALAASAIASDLIKHTDV